MRKRVIIGLMGGDQQPSEAREIGSSVAQLGNILLTGAAIGNKDDKRVHLAAMHAASLTGKARLIGILPCEDPRSNCPGPSKVTRRAIGERSFEDIQSAGVRGFYFHSGITSVERDSITGIAPDALIFLRGSAGTLCELAYAAAAGRTVYFVDSVAFLRVKLQAVESAGKLNRTFAKAQRRCDSVNGGGISVSGLKEVVALRLATARDWSGKLEDLVAEATNVEASKGISSETGFPICFGLNEKREFEPGLRKWSSSVSTFKNESVSNLATIGMASAGTSDDA